MLKTLKWIYNLGKKHEEARIYNAFRDAIRNREEPEWFIEGNDLKDWRKKEYMIQTELDRLVEGVMRPTVYVEDNPQKINRFDETRIN